MPSTITPPMRWENSLQPSFFFEVTPQFGLKYLIVASIPTSPNTKLSTETLSVSNNHHYHREVVHGNHEMKQHLKVIGAKGDHILHSSRKMIFAFENFVSELRSTS